MAEPELREVRLVGTEHYTLSAPGDPRGLTLCGRWIAGTPAGPEGRLDLCNDCQARLGCDECGHGTGSLDSHIWAPALEDFRPAVARFVYDNATCWAEHICRECEPELAAQALAMIGAENGVKAWAAAAR